MQWSHAFDLACRKKDEQSFSKTTKRFGVEAFRDDNTGLGVYIAETGSMAVAPNFVSLKVPVRDSKGPAWLTGLDMPRARRACVNSRKIRRCIRWKSFAIPTPRIGCSSPKRGTSPPPTAGFSPASATRPPSGFTPSIWRSAKGEPRIGRARPRSASKFIGTAIRRTSSISPTPASSPSSPKPPKSKAQGKAPEWLHGLDLKCRRFDEKAFGPDTRKFGVEAYHDLTTGNLIFVSETGSIAVAPAPSSGLKAPTAKPKNPVWTHGLNLPCRKVGEKQFSNETRAFGAEVFRDENLDVIIYINELGNIAVLSAK